MATVERMFKAFEALKIYQNLGLNSSDADSSIKKKEQPLGKKDKIAHCNTIADSICSSSMKTMQEFPKFLGIALETFLACCGDPDADVRMTADECLNRTIKTLLETNLSRIQVELYKEIKKNGPSRSLRAALWRFSDLCHLIRPQKCRPYISNLLSCLVQIARRSEESIQETLAFATSKICQMLGKYTNDGEIKALLRAFLPNLRSTSAVARRTAASCLTAICLYSRKPQHFFAWLLITLIDLVVPVNHDMNVPTVLSILQCFRRIIPHLTKTLPEQDPVLKGSFGSRNREQEYRISLDHLLQVYELLIFFLQHNDHNVVTSSLECLQQLLRTPMPSLLSVLLSPSGIHRTRIFASDKDIIQMNKAGNKVYLSSLFKGEFGSIPSLAGDESNLEDDLDYLNTTDDSNANNYVKSKIEGETTIYSSIRSIQDDLTDSLSYASVEDVEERNSAYSNIKIGRCMEEKIAVVGHTGTIGRAASRRETFRREQESDKQSVDTEDYVGKRSPSPSSTTPQVTFELGDLGTFTDEDIPLIYCTRLISSLFLLTGTKNGLMPERNVRVSVKSLAIGCLSCIVDLYPSALCLNLFTRNSQTERLTASQNVSDVLLFVQHNDPQIRGSTALLIGNFITASLCESRGNFENWLSFANISSDIISLEKLVDLLLVLLADEAAITCRLDIMALKSCLVPLLNSVHGPLALKILSALISLSHSSYWLVKVELLELLPEIAYVTVSHLERMNATTEINRLQPTADYQNLILEKVLLELLGDEDNRVRQSAASSFVKIISQLFFPRDYPQQDPIVCLGRENTAAFLEPIIYESSASLHPPIQGLVFQFGLSNTKCSSNSGTLESALSRIVNLLLTTLSGATSKYLTLGCLHTLSLLSEEYPVTKYPHSWMCCGRVLSNIDKGLMTGNTKLASPTSTAKSTVLPECERGLLSLILSLLTSSSIGMDLTAHQHGLQLATNLFAGFALNCLMPSSATNEAACEDELQPWTHLKDNQVSVIANNLLIHLTRVLSICTHVIEDQSPVPPQMKTALPSLPTAPSLSPIKRKSKIAPESSAASAPTIVPVNRNSPGKGWQFEREDKGYKSNQSGGVSTNPLVASFSGASGASATGGGVSNNMGTFYHLPHYMKLHEILRSAYSNYKISLDLQSSEKFTNLLHTVLNSLAKLFEMATLTEMGRYAEELLRYLKISVSLEPTVTILCVQQLLKALFGTNLASQWEGNSSEDESCKPGRAARLVTAVNPGLYHYCFSAPYNQLSQVINGAAPRQSPIITENKDSSPLFGWIRKKWERKLPSIGKASGKGDKTNLASYIRLFESLVIRALKLYTITSSVDLQCQVLQLLVQLVQLRVNYCLLDSEQLFIGFVLKQFEFIEGGQIQNTEKLIPHIFHFLVLLSYERYHSKPIIGVPKIIQLCDGLMASGQPADTHTIPSLLPIVEDLFLVRGTIYKSDAGKELDIQREVLVSMLFRFIHYHQVLEVFIIILQQNHKESEDRWKKLSRQIIDSILPFLSKLQVNLDNRVALDVLHRLFDAVAPSVFRPVDVLLRVLLDPPRDLSTVQNLQRWLCLVLTVLRVLVAQSKEEVVLSRLAELPLSINIFNDTIESHRLKIKDPSSHIPDHLPSDAAHSPTSDPLSPEEIISRFLLQVVGLVATEIKDRSVMPSSEKKELNFLCQQLAHLLLCITHMFQSGLFRRVANVCMSLIKSEVSLQSKFYNVAQINNAFLELDAVYPTITLQWCNVLILLNFDSLPFWSQILRTPMNRLLSFSARSPVSITSDAPSPCINLELVHKGGLILFCDYICENLSDAEHMTWLIVNRIGELVQLYSEPPINDLISNVHRNPAASGLFIQAINTRCENFSRPSFVRKMLSCLEAIHASQSGSLLTLLVDRFLATPHLALARICASMACRRVEMLLAESPEESSSQIVLEDLDRILQSLHLSGIAKKHTRLMMLLNKLREHCFPAAGPSPLDATMQEMIVVDSNIDSMNKNEYLKLIKTQCCQSVVNRRHCVHLLGNLEYNDLLAIMAIKEFNILLLEDCLTHGVSLFLDHEKNGTQSEQESPLSPLPHTTGGLALYTAARQTLLGHLSNLIALVPAPSQVYNPGSSPTSPREVKYFHRLNDLFSDSTFWDALQQITPVVRQYLLLLRKHSAFSDIPIDSLSDVCRFPILILEAIHWLLHKMSSISPVLLQSSLDTVLFAFYDPNLFTILTQKDCLNWICSAIYSIRVIFDYVHRPTKSGFVWPDSLPSSAADNEIQHVMNVCTEMANMIFWMERQKMWNNCYESRVLSESVCNIVVGLARLPIVNSFARTPPLAWQLGWTPDGFKNMLVTPLPPLPVNLLQERDVLWQFIFRVNLLGWTSRQQFEETWMALLGVLSAVPSGELTGSEEEAEHVHTACLAIKCITSLLLQTLLLPQPGNSCDSKYLKQPCEKPLAYLHTRHGKRFSRIWNIVDKRRQILTGIGDNQQRSTSLPCMTINEQLRTKNYGAGQVSLEYLQFVVGNRGGSSSHGPVSFEEREKCLISSGLDLHSCLHFLLDLYSQWMSPTNASSQLALLTEAVRSVVMLSDIFTEKAQFEWMLDTLLEIHRSHPPEDEIMAQYLSIGICKATAVLGIDSDSVESFRKVLEQSFKSTFLSTRIMALYGVMYLLELGPNELTQPVLTYLCEYLLLHVQNSQLSSSQSEDHTLILWTVIFYLIENFQEYVMETDFGNNVMKHALETLLLSPDTVSSQIQLSITRGLERLVLTNVINGKSMEPILKVGVDRFCQPNPIVSSTSLGLLLSCIYAGKDNEKWRQDALMIESTAAQQLPDESTEYLISAMEKITILFNRMKRSYPSEAETIAEVLPHVLTDYFPLNDIMNKVIGEFISNQQPHPHLLAGIVFRVFEWAQKQGQYSLVREWVLLSLSNFTQQSPMALAIWSLTCFFISASLNPWMRDIFPFVQQRMAKLNALDVHLFCIASLDFYRQLLNENEKQIFYSTISSVAQPNTPYGELLARL